MTDRSVVVGVRAFGLIEQFLLAQIIQVMGITNDTNACMCDSTLGIFVCLLLSYD
jgi:hypothetical protein